MVPVKRYNNKINPSGYIIRSTYSMWLNNKIHMLHIEYNNTIVIK